MFSFLVQFVSVGLGVMFGSINSVLFLNKDGNFFFLIVHAIASKYIYGQQCIISLFYYVLFLLSPFNNYMFPHDSHSSFVEPIGD